MNNFFTCRRHLTCVKISSIKILQQFLIAFVLSSLPSEDTLDRTDILPDRSMGGLVTTSLYFSPGTEMLCPVMPADIMKDVLFSL